MNRDEAEKANETARAALRGKGGDACYKTAKGWARVVKVRTRTSQRVEVDGDGKQTVTEETAQVVYLDTVGDRRARVKLGAGEVAKLDTLPHAQAAKAQADDEKAAREKAASEKAAQGAPAERLSGRRPFVPVPAEPADKGSQRQEDS